MEKDAIIILDLQNCFIKENNNELIQKIKNHLQKRRYNFIIFSKFINSKNSNFFKKLNWKKCTKSPDTEIVKELSEIAKTNQIFEKQTYSIFKSKQFSNFLKKNKILKLYFCGLDIDACVLASVFEAFDLGYNYEILTNLTGSSSKKNMKISAEKIIERNL